MHSIQTAVYVVYSLALPLYHGCVQAIQSGTIAFIQQLRKRKCGDASEVVLPLSGDQFTIEYLQEHGFSKPVLVECKDGLGIVVPHSSFTVADVEKHVGEYVCMYVYVLLLLYVQQPTEVV